MTHIRLAIWILCVLWKEKTISRMDRFRLFSKTICLYWSLLGFADIDRPRHQLWAAMVGALMTSIYDYETDMSPVARFEDSICARLLRDFPVPTEAYHVAVDMMRRDLAKQFSPDGLERGSSALLFYILTINPEWMREYSRDDIRCFGRLLQIIDDMQDFERDMETGDQNCFRDPRTRDAYIAELEAFLESEFYQELAKRSFVYTYLRFECMHNIDRMQCEQEPTWWQLLKVGRIHTALYALVVTYLGFAILKPIDWYMVCASSIPFALVTMSIMMLNDIVDWKIDMRKGKPFAYQHMFRLTMYWMKLNAWTALSCAPLLFLNPTVAVFIGLVWFVGLAYNCIKQRAIAQAHLVGFCAASPVLCASVHTVSLTLQHFSIFCFFYSLIIGRERLSDIRDRDADRGEKETLATKWQCNPPSILPVIISAIFAIISLFPFPTMIYPLSAIMALLMFPLTCIFIFTEEAKLNHALAATQVALVTAMFGFVVFTL